MLNWFRVDCALVTHPKVIDLASRMDVVIDVAIGRFIRLLGGVATHADDGDLSLVSDAAIASWMGWLDDPAALVAILVDCGFLDGVTRVVHGWKQRHASCLDARGRRDASAVRRSEAGRIAANARWSALTPPTEPPPTEPLEEVDAIPMRSHETASESHMRSQCDVDASTLPIQTDDALSTRECQRPDEPPPVAATSPMPLQAWWNGLADLHGLPRIKAMTLQRRAKAGVRSAAGMWDARDKIAHAIASDAFYRGAKGWRITFDYLVANDTNWLKVVERGEVATLGRAPSMRPDPSLVDFAIVDRANGGAP
jgi:hypothetical protein